MYLKRIELKEEKIRCWGRYPFSLPIIKNLKSLDFKSNVTFLVGENGSGKSTLIEAIAIKCGFNPEGGSKNFKFSSYDSHSKLYEHLVVTKGFKTPKDGFFLRAESFYNVANYIEKLDQENMDLPPLKNQYGGSLHEQSHGESFLSLIQNRFRGNGLYILDEPEAALSPSRQLSLIILINELVKKNSQFIIATHSPILLTFPNADVISLEQDAISHKPYYETEHFILTKQFINNPDKMLHLLLD